MAVSFIGSFILLPLYTSMYISKASSQMEAEDFTIWAANNFASFFHGSHNLLMIFFIGIMGLICAVTGYTYLQSKVKQDFFHSMPVKRGQWFGISYISGILIFLIPYLIMSLFTLLAGQLFHILNGAILAESLAVILSGILMFLITYSTAILAMMLTGQLVTGILASIVIFVYPYLLIQLSHSLSSMFFSTWSNASVTTLYDIFRNISPIYLFGNFVNDDVSVYQHLFAVIFILIMLVISYLLCKHYPAEAAENTLSYRKMEPLIKVLISVPCALFIACVVNLFMGMDSYTWFYIPAFLSVVLLCFVIEFIYHHDIRLVLKGFLSTAASVILTVLVICVFRFDLIGFDSYQPQKDDVDHFVISNSEIENYFNYNFLYGDNGQLYCDNIDSMYTLIENGIANSKMENETVRSENGEIEDSNLLSVHVDYCLKNGKSKYRLYEVDRDVFKETLLLLSKDPEFIRNLFPIFKVDQEKVSSISILDAYRQEINMNLNPEQLQQLLTAYEKDILEADFTTFIDEYPVAHFNLSYTSKNSRTANTYTRTFTPPAASNQKYALDNLYIYESFENTLRVLEDLGYPVRTHIDVADILSASYRNYELDEAYQITGEEKIREMAEQIKSVYTNRLLDRDTYWEENLLLTYTNGYTAAFCYAPDIPE